MIAYLRRCLALARSKWTTWAAVVSGNIALLPTYIHDYWGQLEQQIPRLRVYHAAVVVLGILFTIWARVRQEAKVPP